jgi:hypothetical protein
MPVEITVTVPSWASSLVVSAKEGALASSKELVKSDRWNLLRGSGAVMSGMLERSM